MVEEEIKKEKNLIIQGKKVIWINLQNINNYNNNF